MKNLPGSAMMPFLLRFTLVLSASLLFIIEPFIGKFVLPYFGGGSGVWSVCLLFFTLLLLGGYAYGYFLAKLGVLRALSIHLATLLVLTAILAVEWLWFGMPILPKNPLYFVELFAHTPSLSILLTLILAVGIPFFLLSTTSTMVQLWSAYSDRTTEPYRLYTLSNIASLSGLLAYPILIEPFFTLHTLAWVWGILFLVYVMAYAYTAVLTGQMCVGNTQKTELMGGEANISQSISARRYLLWLLYSGLPACLLVSTTVVITRDIAPMPLFWIFPLALYLISYALAFGPHKLGSTFIEGAAFFSGLGIIFFVGSHGLLTVGVIDVFAFFFITHLFHCLLYADRPNEAQLASFYLAISIGGALGTVLATIVIPIVFRYPIELPFLFFAGCIVAMLHIPFFKVKNILQRRIVVYGIPTILLTYTLIGSFLYISHLVVGTRNFYGTLYVTDISATSTVSAFRELTHGKIAHGRQFLNEKESKIPTTYFSFTSGVGRALRHRQSATTSEGLSVGVIGLGAGTLAAYCRPEDSFTFYEINPGVIKIANEQFTYLKQCANYTIVEGDARLSMEREQKSSTPPRYDILIVDAFSGDAIPVHLLTKEAFALYRAQLRDERSMVLVHISNIYIELAPVVFGGGQSAGLSSVYIIDNPSTTPEHAYTTERAVLSRWAALGFNAQVLADLRTEGMSIAEENAHAQPALWTDDFSNIISHLKWRLFFGIKSTD